MGADRVAGLSLVSARPQDPSFPSALYALVQPDGDGDCFLAEINKTRPETLVRTVATGFFP